MTTNSTAFSSPEKENHWLKQNKEIN